MSCHVVSCRVMSCHVVSCHVMSCYVHKMHFPAVVPICHYLLFNICKLQHTA